MRDTLRDEAAICDALGRVKPATVPPTRSRPLGETNPFTHGICLTSKAQNHRPNGSKTAAHLDRTHKDHHPALAQGSLQ